LREAGYPVVGEEDLALAATLAEQSDAPARKVDVLADQPDDLVHPHARADHQGDGEQCRRLVRSLQHGALLTRRVDVSGPAQGAEQASKVVGRDDAGEAAGAASHAVRALR